MHLLSYWIDWLLWDLHPAGLHGLNVALYAAGCALLHRLALAMKLPPQVALAAALLFAVHPIHVEPVAWISARKDCLMLPLVAGACLSWLRGDLRGRLTALALAAAAAWPSPRPWSCRDCCWLWSSCAVPAAGGRAWRSDSGLSCVRWRHYVMVSALVALMALAAQSGEGAVKIIPGGPGARVGTMARALVFDLRLALFPYPLSAYYDLMPSTGFGLRRPGRLLLLLLLLAAAVWAWRSRWKHAGVAAFALLWSAAAISPVSGIVPLAVLAADRYLLLPSFAITVFAAALAWSYAPRKRSGGSLPRASSPSPWASMARARVWKSDCHSLGEHRGPLTRVGCGVGQPRRCPGRSRTAGRGAGRPG